MKGAVERRSWRIRGRGEWGGARGPPAPEHPALALSLPGPEAIAASAAAATAPSTGRTSGESAQWAWRRSGPEGVPLLPPSNTPLLPTGPSTDASPPNSKVAGSDVCDPPWPSTTAIIGADAAASPVAAAAASLPRSLVRLPEAGGARAAAAVAASVAAAGLHGSSCEVAPEPRSSGEAAGFGGSAVPTSESAASLRTSSCGLGGGVGGDTIWITHVRVGHIKTLGGVVLSMAYTQHHTTPVSM